MSNLFKIILIGFICTSCSLLPSPTPLSIQADIQTAEWSKKWWMPRHEEKLAKKKEIGNVGLVFLGDSITHAWDNKGKAEWQEYYSKHNALNIGFSGDRTENVLWRIAHGAVDDIDPKLLVLMIGTNNTGHRQDKPADTALGIKTILSNLEDKLPNTKVLLLAIFPRGATKADPLRKINDDINNIIKNFDNGDSVHYLDINHIFLDASGDLSKTVMNDLLHPNRNQYKRWAEVMDPKISALMK